MARKIRFTPETFHHIYNRGTEKRKIFLDKKDYYRFLTLLYLCNNSFPVDLRNMSREGLTFAEIINTKRSDVLVDIGAYCLMPNHIHLLTKSKNEKQTSKFLQKLFTAYTMYFNKRYERTGRLFESSCKSKFVDNDEYLKYLFAYIHLNPVKLLEPAWKEKGIQNASKAKKYLDTFLWSSYGYHTNKNKINSILNISAFPRYFRTAKDFDDFIDDWLNFED